MTETKKGIALARAATEFNVGKDRIVEVLNSKGIKIENKPGFKLSPEMIEVLVKEFKHDTDVLQSAREIDLNKKKDDLELSEGGKVIHKKDTIEPFAKTTVEESAEKKKAVKKVETEEPLAEKVETKKVKLDGVTTTGKIDLGEVEPPKKKKGKKSAKDQVEEEIAEVPVEEVAEEKADVIEKEEKAEPEVVRLRAKKLEGPKIVDKIILKKEPERKKEEQKEKPKPVVVGETPAGGETIKRERKKFLKHTKVDINKAQRFDSTTEKRDPKALIKNKYGETAAQSEVSKKEIEDKIKDTLARIQGGVKGKNTRSKFRKQKRDAHAETREASVETGKKIQVTEFISVSELASLMNVAPTDVISKCMSLGIIVSINQRLDADVITLVADEFGYEVEFINVAEQDFEDESDVDAPEDLKERAPIVTIMGHVDHGKTSLLDKIREANVVAGEVGGITQHIGAYEVTTNKGRHITFLDTPGHEAFTAMRARGAKLTDIAVIVIAADDAVMPQTREAISHAQAAGVPMIFAFNKIDKPGANVERIREQLAQMNLLVEDWGGKFQSQEISAKQSKNIDLLLDKILLESEMLNLKANPDKVASGTVIEATLDKGRGYVTTILVQEGTLRVGDVLVAGHHFGKVKAMYNERGQRLTVAPPATPLQLLGLSGAPQAGDHFKVFEDEQEAKKTAAKREQIVREQGLRTRKHITLDEIGRRLALGTFKELNLIIKGDVDGSVEALSDSLLKLSTPEIQVNIIHKGVGGISEGDIQLASASDAVIVGFQVRPSLYARKMAEAENIEIRLYSIIYDAIEEIKAAMEGMMEPKIEEKIVCNIEIREVFKITKVGTIAGCYVLDGKMKRDTKVRVVREGIVVYTGSLASLKRFKDDVKEVTSGFECGLNIENFNDIKVGDIIEGYEEVEVKRKL